MKLQIKIRYEEEYLPTKRHRVPRIRKVEEEIAVELREIKKEDAPVAMVVTDYKSYRDENGQDQFGLRDTSFHAIDGLLFSEKRDMSGALDRGVYTLEFFAHDLERSGDCQCSWPANKRSKEDMLRYVQDFLDSHVMIDGTIYQQKNEPRYVVMTFGLGHNHGGTALMIDTHYNENLSKDQYFNALQFDEAVTYADEVATARGDTKYVGTFGDKRIKVFMPEMVRCDPNTEHGLGSPFLNQMEDLVRSSSDSLESGLLVMAGASALSEPEKKLSLDEKIRAARSQVSDANNNEHKNKEHEIE